MDRAQLIIDVFDSYRYMRHAFMPPKPVNASPNAPTRAQLGILFVVAQGKALSIKELAEQLCMTSSAATQLVDSLVQLALISRTEDADDRRKIRLILTKKGEKLLKEAREQRLKALTQILSPLTDNELKQLAVLQQKLSRTQR